MRTKLQNCLRTYLEGSVPSKLCACARAHRFQRLRTRQGRLVMEAEKAAAYPTRLFVFFLLKFLFWRFLEMLGRPVNNLSPLPPPPPPLLPLDRKN